MAKFKYTAIDQNGKEKKGKIDANSEEEAAAQILGMGLMATELNRIGAGGEGVAMADGGRKKKSILDITIGSIVSQEGLTVFTRQLATLLDARLPLLRSLEVMIRQEKNKLFKGVLVDLADSVRSGNNLSDGLLAHPKVFDKLYVNMVKAGEAGGVLDVVLSRLADFMEKSLKTKKKVKSAMTYPVVVMTFAVLIVMGLMIVVVPRFEQIFSDMKAELPQFTQTVLGMSRFIQHNIVVTIGVVVGLFILISVLNRTPQGKRMFDWLKINVPKFGHLGRMAAISRFTRTFGTLLSAGVPILQALTITRDIMGNVLFVKALDEVHDRVRDGETLAAPMEQTKIFPTMVTSMVEVGEETGELPEMLNRIANNYDEDLDNAIAGITSLIEPLLIIFLALVVGGIVLALFLPIINIMTQLS